MTIWNNGMINIVQDSKENVKRVREVMDEFGFDDMRIVGDGDDGITFISIEDYPGNIDDDFRRMNAKLFKLGIALWGSYEFKGDYDGVVVVRDGNLESWDREWDILKTGDDQVIIGELKVRGYDVSCLDEQLEKRHAEGKDKVVPF